ncbi:MAG TPA: FecR family protein [Candidatus Syntrophosphaera sp.]|nr:FecR family protein [Candidatus Syntrophosphaera sp.]
MCKKLYLVILLGLLITVLTAAESVAYLMQGKGNLQILRASRSIKYKNGELLLNNDEVKTGSEAFAAIKYLDGGAIVKVFPSSIIKLAAKKQGKTLDKNTSLNQGSLYSKVNNKIKGNYQVETPTTVASVKGTGFLTKYTEDRKTIVIVLEGVVEVQHKESGKRTTTNAGFTTVISENGDLDTHPTTEVELSQEERTEINTTDQQDQKTMKIQVIDENGNLKYIEITY